MKKRYIVLIVAVVALLMALIGAIVVPYAVSMFMEEAKKSECESLLEADALEFLEQNVEGFDADEWQSVRIYSLGSDDAVDAHNKENPDDYIYPFVETNIYFMQKNAPLTEMEDCWVVHFKLSDDKEHEVIEIRLIKYGDIDNDMKQ